MVLKESKKNFQKAGGGNNRDSYASADTEGQRTRNLTEKLRKQLNTNFV